MLLIYIFQIALAVSIFGIIFIIVRNLPLVPEYKVKYIPKEKKISFRLRRGVSEGRIKATHKSHKIKEKIGRKIRIWILKFDNFLISRIQKTRERRMHLENIYFAKLDKIKKRKEKVKRKKNKKTQKRGGN